MTYCLPKGRPEFLEAVRMNYAAWNDKRPAKEPR